MQETLRDTVADLMGVDPSEMMPERALSGGRLKGSLGRSLLYAALRKRLGVECDGAYSAKTYGELEARLLGTTPSPASASARPATLSAAPKGARSSVNGRRAVACGVDIELVADLPTASDPWEHEWYRSHFSDSEIAYCLLQSSPVQHFAGRWCAKEALKKCESSLIAEPMAHLEIVSADGGAISLCQLIEGRRHPLPHAVSISHTPLAAVAVVVRAESAASPAAPTASSVAAPSPAAAGPLTRLPLICSIAAIILSIVTLLICLRR